MRHLIPKSLRRFFASTYDEEQLRVSEQRLRLLADSARDVVWTMSPLGAVTYVSPAVEALRGITPEQAMQQSIDETLTPESRDVVLQYFADVGAAVHQCNAPPQFRGTWNTGETMVRASGPRCWLFR
jgi:PAS domain-containing protein